MGRNSTFLRNQNGTPGDVRFLFARVRIQALAFFLEKLHLWVRFSAQIINVGTVLQMWVRRRFFCLLVYTRLPWYEFKVGTAQESHPIVVALAVINLTN